MLVDVDFLYPAQVVPRPRAKPVTAWYRATASFEVREGDEASAPVAAWWSPDRAKLPREAQVAIRAMDGDLWQPVLEDVYGLVPAMPDGRRVTLVHDSGGGCVRDAQDGVKALTSYAFLDDLRSTPLFAREKADDPRDAYRVESEQKAAYEAEIRSGFGDFAVIGGMVHRRLSTPLVRVSSDGRKVGMGAKEDYSYERGRHLEFPLARFADAVAAAPDGAVPARPPEVLIPTALAFDEERHVVEGAVDAALSRVARAQGAFGSRGSILSQYPDNVVLSYVALRDARAAGDLAATREAALAYADAVGSLYVVRDDEGDLRAALARSEADAEDMDLELAGAFPCA